MKILIKKHLNDIGWATSLNEMINYRFPVISPITEQRGFIDYVSSRDYHNVNELLAARLVVKALDKENGEFVIKTKADYDKFIIMVNDYLDIANYGAVLEIGEKIKEDVE